MSLLIHSQKLSKRELLKESTNSSHVTESSTIVPHKCNVWVAGTPNMPLIQIQPAHVHDSPVRSMHQGAHSGQSVQVYFKFAPTPLGLSSSSLPPRTQANALRELTRYAGDIMTPITCSRVSSTTIGSEIYESDDQYMSSASCENLATNMIEHDLCLQGTVTDPVLAFQPFTVKITGHDLKNCIEHATAIESNNVLSKFIKTESQIAPHSLLIHVVQDPFTRTHKLYGVSFTQKDKF